MLAQKSGSSLAIDAAISGATAGLVLYVGTGGVLAQETLASLGGVVAGGVAGGQTINGGVNAADALTLMSTAHATKGLVYLGSPYAWADGVGNLCAVGGSLTQPSFSFAESESDGLGYYSGNLLFFEGGVLACVLTSSLASYRIPSDWSYTWSSASTNEASSDTGVVRAGPGVVLATNGSTGGGSFATGNSLTAGRPAVSVVGAQWFDTTLGCPIWWNGAHWVNASGTQV